MGTWIFPTDAFAAVYDLLALAYLRGPLALRDWRSYRTEALFEILEVIEPGLSSALSSMLLMDESVAAAAEQEFLERIVIPSPGRFVPPYASVHLEGLLWGRSSLEVSSWYAAEGIVWDSIRPGYGESRILAPDHIGVELAFLSIASRRGSEGEPHPRSVVQPVDSMLRHLSRWLPLFKEALERMEIGLTVCCAVSCWTTFALEIINVDLARRRGPKQGKGPEF